MKLYKRGRGNCSCFFSTSPSIFTHVDEEKSLPKMVNVQPKATTKRVSIARGNVVFPPETFELLKSSKYNSAKGPIISTSIVAGVLAAKKTPEIIPFCHHVPLDGCDITIIESEKIPNALQIDCCAYATYKTGIEMEALVGVSAAALCVYDMCKAASHNIQITDIGLVSKSGGKSDFKLQD